MVNRRDKNIHESGLQELLMQAQLRMGEGTEEEPDETEEEPAETEEASAETEEEFIEADLPRTSILLKPAARHIHKIREKSVNRRLRLAEDRLHRLRSLERVVEVDPRFATRRRLVERSIRLQKELIAELKTQAETPKEHTDKTRYIKVGSPSKVLRRKKAENQFGHSISKAGPKKSR